MALPSLTLGRELQLECLLLSGGLPKGDEAVVPDHAACMASYLDQKGLEKESQKAFQFAIVQEGEKCHFKAVPTHEVKAPIPESLQGDGIVCAGLNLLDSDDTSCALVQDPCKVKGRFHRLYIPKGLLFWRVSKTFTGSSGTSKTTQKEEKEVEKRGKMYKIQPFSKYTEELKQKWSSQQDFAQAVLFVYVVASLSETEETVETVETV
jgi:hypothetical protein